MMTDGNNFSEMLMNVKGDCPNCGTTLTFMESAQLAKDNDINEDAVMCHKCGKVYTVNITLHEMNFVKEVTTITNNTEKDYITEYAKYFKESIEEENLEKAQNILKNWLSDYPDDANMFYATVIVRTLEGKSTTDSLKVILDSASKVNPKDTDLKDWYIEKANKSIEIQKELKDEETKGVNDKFENNQSEIVRPTFQQNVEQNRTPEDNLQQFSNDEMKKPIQQPNYQQQIPQQAINNNNYNQQVQEDRSIFEILFYKRDKKTQEFRISKTKTISILIFLFIFIFMLISMIMLPETETDPSYIVGYIIGSIIVALIVAVPVFLLGYLISYLLERDSGNNNNQYNQIPNQQYQNIPNPNYNPNQQYNPNISMQQDNPQQPHSNLDFSPKTEPTQPEPTQTELQTFNNKYYEKDNMGSRHDTVQIANGYWLGERFQMEEKHPFTLFTFRNAQDAEDALLELPYIHKASDTGNLICDDVYIFGYYKVSEGNYEAIICGKDLTYDEFLQAEDSFIKHGGTRKNKLEPEKNKEKVNKAPNKISSVKFREKFNKDQYTYECYDADTKADALEFLKKQEVSKGLYYICVYTPEGDFGRDINGIYQM